MDWLDSLLEFEWVLSVAEVFTTIFGVLETVANIIFTGVGWLFTGLAFGVDIFGWILGLFGSLADIISGWIG